MENEKQSEFIVVTELFGELEKIALDNIDKFGFSSQTLNRNIGSDGHEIFGDFSCDCQFKDKYYTAMRIQYRQGKFHIVKHRDQLEFELKDPDILEKLERYIKYQLVWPFMNGVIDSLWNRDFDSVVRFFTECAEKLKVDEPLKSFLELSTIYFEKRQNS